MKKHLLIIAIILFSSINLFSQAQLVQSFVEVNKPKAEKYGISVSSAGDVNNDGYNDIIVGASNYNNYDGRVYIYYGGNSVGNIADVIIDGEDDSYFGFSASTAGDINNDGYDDVIVGAYYHNSGTGHAYIYYGGSSMDNVADITMTGEGTSNYFGYSVSDAGDVNNDGYDDVIVGAYGYNSNVGRVYIYYGGNFMNNISDITIDGEGSSSHYGYSVSNAGDVNNDEYDDVIVGAGGYHALKGRTYIYYGGSSMDSSVDVTMDGEGYYNYFGFSVSTAGDVNSDGYDDVVIGAEGYSSSTGRSYIYYGGSLMDNTADIIMTGETTSNYFGRTVSIAGDVNNDGYDDVIVGAYGYNSSTGRTYVYYGGSSMDNTVDIIMTGETTNSNFGYSVSDVGDVNNNGYDDVIVGAYGYNSSTGRSYVYYGGSSMDNNSDITMDGEGTSNWFGYSVSTAGDVNNDGYGDIIVGSTEYNTFTGRAYVYFGGYSMDNIADVTVTGEAIFSRLGCSVSTAGDVNSDGYDDVIVGARGFNSSTGRAYIYYGGSSMDNSADVTMTGETTRNLFGRSVSTAGDLNNDGYDDVIVGAYYYNSETGRAYIYYGGSSMDNIADITMTGGATSNKLGHSVSTAGDVNSDGYDDVIVGEPGASHAYIYYGGSSMDNIADITMDEGSAGYSVSTAGDVNNDGYDDVIVGADEHAYIYLGANSMDDVADVTMSGEGGFTNFGRSVSTAGDLNNDGYDDVIVGAFSYESYKGKVYIYYGGSSMDNNADITMDGEGTDNSFGHSVSTAGDVNGDGYDDFIVGAYQRSFNGKAYIYSDPSAPMPVELTTFTAASIRSQERNYSATVLLNWTTATEVNNYGFEIERQILKQVQNDNNWQEIGFVNGHGNSNSPKDYSFIDTDISVADASTLLSNQVSYRLKQIDIDGSFEYSDVVTVEMETPKEFKLSQNYPNPFNPTTMISYTLPTDSKVKVEIFNSLGQSVAVLVNSKKSAGHYESTWNAQNLPSGIYLINIRAEGLDSKSNFSQVKKALLLK